MKVIISPAKKMNIDLDSLEYSGLPQFIEQAEKLKSLLSQLSYEELKKLWKCNDKICALNQKRLETMDLKRRLTPAILAYEGIQFQYMAPGVFTNEELAYIQKHLVILSGFYGLLRPLDGVTPYRLEMQARLSGQGFRSLYDFWGDTLAKKLACETDIIINLASKEYSKSISAHLPKGVRFLTCSFGEWKDGRLIEKGTMCKMARGEMVRFMAENNVETVQQLKQFWGQGYTFSSICSNDERYVFVKAPKSQKL